MNSQAVAMGASTRPSIMLPSPAGSLAGRPEGYYLSTYFTDFHAMCPLTDLGNIQAAICQSKGVIGDTGAPMKEEGDHGLHEMEYYVSHANSTTLWGCIAIGKLLQESNTQGVNVYTSTAWKHFKKCYDYSCEQVVSAYLVMAVMFLLLGDARRFARCVTEAHRMFLVRHSDSYHCCLQFPSNTFIGRSAQYIE